MYDRTAIAKEIYDLVEKVYEAGYDEGSETTEITDDTIYRQGFDDGFHRAFNQIKSHIKEAIDGVFGDFKHEPVEDEPKATMPEIGEMEQLAKQFFDYCNGITGKGSE